MIHFCEIQFDLWLEISGLFIPKVLKITWHNTLDTLKHVLPGMPRDFVRFPSRTEKILEAAMADTEEVAAEVQVRMRVMPGRRVPVPSAGGDLRRGSGALSPRAASRIDEREPLYRRPSRARRPSRRRRPRRSHPPRRQRRRMRQRRRARRSRRPRLPRRPKRRRPLPTKPRPRNPPRRAAERRPRRTSKRRSRRPPPTMPIPKARRRAAQRRPTRTRKRRRRPPPMTPRPRNPQRRAAQRRPKRRTKRTTVCF